MVQGLQTEEAELNPTGGAEMLVRYYDFEYVVVGILPHQYDPKDNVLFQTVLLKKQ